MSNTEITRRPAWTASATSLWRMKEDRFEDGVGGSDDNETSPDSGKDCADLSPKPAKMFLSFRDGFKCRQEVAQSIDLVRRQCHDGIVSSMTCLDSGSVSA